MAEADLSVRARIAYLGAKKPYRRVFDHHGWGHVHEKWTDMAQRGETAAMGNLVDDEMLHTFAVVAEPEHVASAIVERYAGLSDRASVMTPYATVQDLWDSIGAGIRAYRNGIPA
nr:hypothetical protein [Nocardia mangyaensis]